MSHIIIGRSNERFTFLLAEAITSLGYRVIIIGELSKEEADSRLALAKMSEFELLLAFNNSQQQLVNALNSFALSSDDCNHLCSQFPTNKKRISVHSYAIGSPRRVPIIIKKHRGSHFHKG